MQRKNKEEIQMLAHIMLSEKALDENTDNLYAQIWLYFTRRAWKRND
jgi:hypothetical protein